MGKTRIKRRCKNPGDNPTGIPSIKDMESDELEFSDFEAGDVDCILEKLQNSATDKQCAAYNISTMAGSPSFMASVVKNKVIRIAGPLLVDREPAVRQAIAGCLRNLAERGDLTVCQSMVDQDIFTSLTALLSEYKEPWSPTPLEDKIDLKSEIFLESCNMISTLCDKSETAVAIFNKRKLIRILLPCLNIGVYGLQIPLSVAQCLYSVGILNPEVTEELSQPLVQEQLKTLMTLESKEPEYVLLKTLAAGIMMNTILGKVHNIMNDVTNPIIKVVADILSEPINPALLHLFEDITSHKQEWIIKYQNKKEKKDEEHKLNALTKTPNTLDYMLQAKEIALKVLTSICTDDDSDDEWDDISTSDASEEMEMDIDEISETPLKLGIEVPSEIHLIIMHHKLLQKVVEQIVIPPEDIMKVMLKNSKGKAILKRLNEVKRKALLCLNNMIDVLTIDDLGGPAKLFDLWMYIANLLFRQTDLSNTELLEATTRSMRTVLEKLAKGKCSSQFSNLTEADLVLLINICHQSQDAGVKVNVINALGNIGRLIGDPELLHSTHKLITNIGVFLLEICSKSSDVWVIAESLDVIMDVFSEDHVDYIAQEINLVEKLDHLQKIFKGKVKQQRNSLGEGQSVIQEVKRNLIRFIKYKYQLQKK